MVVLRVSCASVLVVLVMVLVVLGVVVLSQVVLAVSVLFPHLPQVKKVKTLVDQSVCCCF